MGKRGCRTPSVQNCLHCEKPECDCCYRTKPHISEIIALVNVGMAKPQAIKNHLSNKGRRFGKGVIKNEQKTTVE
jgi:hypothetical protein